MMQPMWPSRPRLDNNGQARAPVRQRRINPTRWPAPASVLRSKATAKDEGKLCFVCSDARPPDDCVRSMPCASTWRNRKKTLDNTMGVVYTMRLVDAASGL